MARRNFLEYRKLEVEYEDKKGNVRKKDLIIVPQYTFLVLCIWPVVDFIWDMLAWWIEQNG